VVRGKRAEWIGNLTAYTVAGAASSAAVGAALAFTGSLALPSDLGAIGPSIAVIVAVITLTRELGLLPMPLPQLGRQSVERWAKLLPLRTAAGLWGLDIGLSFATKLNYSGGLLLAAIALLSRHPVFGIVIFVAYWFGRAGSAWLGPWLLAVNNEEVGGRDVSPLIAAISSQRKLFAWVHIAALFASLLALTTTAAIGQGF
jgi:hypothetical protein